MKASVLLPVALSLLDENQDSEQLKKEAYKLIRTLKITFYVLTITWFVICLVTGEFIWRMASSVLYLYLMIVFMFSLINIRNLIDKVNSKDYFKTNNSLLNLNLITFGSVALTFGISFFLSIM